MTIPAELETFAGNFYLKNEEQLYLDWLRSRVNKENKRKKWD